MDKERFCRLWNRCAGAGQQRAAALFSALDAYYGEPHRHYHTGVHIEDCLSRMDLAAAQLVQPDSVELAVWFHDVIYQPGAADNERRSADWFAEQAAGLLAPDLIRRVENYIMSTTHCEPPADDGAQWVVDVDLSGLGMETDMFQRDGDNIRREFTHLSDAEFIRGQTRFLQSLLDRERIYYTPFFYDLCETRARRNIRNTLERYAGGAALSPGASGG